MALSALKRQRHSESTSAKIIRLMVVLASVCLCTTAQGGVLNCRAAGEEEYNDPLGRDGLSTEICRLPKPGRALVIVSDQSLSWPVLIAPTQTISFEEDMLSNKLGFSGLPFFNSAQDHVVYFDEPERLFISVTTNDPVSLAPVRVWLRIDTATGQLAKIP